MTELDKRKMIIKKIFDRLPQEAHKEAREVYGDDLLLWHTEYLKKQEMQLKAREEKLRKLGVNIDTIKAKIHEYMSNKFGGEE